MKIKNADGEWIDIHDIPTSPMSSQTHKVPMPGIGMICVAIGVHFPPSRWVPLRWRTLRLRESTRELGRRGARWVGSSPQLGSLVCHCAGPYATRTDRTQHIRPRDSTNERGGATTAPHLEQPEEKSQRLGIDTPLPLYECLPFTLWLR